MKTETLQLPLKLHYLICGKKRGGLLPIIEETSTNIYFPSPFDQQGDVEADIYITGEQTQVTRVKGMLNKLAVQKVYINSLLGWLFFIAKLKKFQ